MTPPNPPPDAPAADEEGKRTVPFNINDYVRVKVTPHGENVRAAKYRAMGIDPPPIIRNTDGWTTEQLWMVMWAYGSAMCNGCELSIETTIEFEVSHE